MIPRGYATSLTKAWITYMLWNCCSSPSELRRMREISSSIAVVLDSKPGWDFVSAPFL